MSPLRNNPLLRIALCFAAGIVVGDVLSPFSVPTLYYLLLSALFLVCAAMLDRVRTKPFRRPVVVSVLLLVSVAALGAWRYQTIRDRVVTDWPDEAVDCRAVVRSDAVPRRRSVRYTLDVAGRRVYGYVYGAEEATTYAWGDTLMLRHVVIRQPRNFSDSLTYDYARSLYCRRVSGTVMIPAESLESLRSLESSKGLWSLRSRAVGWLRARYAEASLPDDVLGVVEALSLGDKSRMSDDVRDAYAEAGASHLLALSGLHVGVLYALLMLTLGLVFRSPMGKRLCHLLAALLLWAFAVLTGLSPSLVRAVTMFTVYAVVMTFGGDRSPLSALALAALVMLGIQPFSLFDVSFQLSFVSMLSILLLMPWYEAWRLRSPLLTRSRLIEAPVGMVAVSVAAQAGVAPLVLHWFGRFPTYFLVTNMVVLPFIYAVMVLMVLWIVLSWTSLAPMLASLLTATVRALNTLLAAIARWPGSSLRVGHFTFVDALLLWAVFFFFVRFVLRRHTPSAVWALACLAALLVARTITAVP